MCRNDFLLTDRSLASPTDNTQSIEPLNGAPARRHLNLKINLNNYLDYGGSLSKRARTVEKALPNSSVDSCLFQF